MKIWGDNSACGYISQSILLDPLYFLVLEKKYFFPPSHFFEFMRTMLSSLLSTIYVYNTITGYSRPFKAFYKVICSVACVYNSFYIRFYKHGVF